MGQGLRGWEETTWIATRSGRTALALALTRMMTAGEITRSRAEEIARMVLRDNAIRLYNLAPVSAAVDVVRDIPYASWQQTVEARSRQVWSHAKPPRSPGGRIMVSAFGGPL